jgi:hypothetical protein
MLRIVAVSQCYPTSSIDKKHYSKAGEKPIRPTYRPDRFDRARGQVMVKWRTDELMRLLRGDE